MFNNSASDIEKFCLEVDKNIQSQPFDRNLFSDPNRNYEILHNILLNAKEKYIPVQVKQANKYKHKLSPWITAGIMRSIKFRDNLYKKLKSLDPASENYSDTEINLKISNVILRRSIRWAKIDYYHKQLEK